MSLVDSKISYPHVKDLLEPTGAEIDQVVEVFVDAFLGDPFSAILLGGNLDLAPQQLRANVQAALIGGQVHVITVGPKATDIVGASIWFPPGSSAFSSEDQRAAGWNQFLEAVPESLRRWWMDYFVPTVSQLSTNALGSGYLLDSWHLHIFGVMKAHQRKGYGKVLFQLAETRAKQNHTPLVLETTTELDVTIYKMLGFHVCAETAIGSSVGDARMWLMLKET
ncbi:hypothetical protein GALMADRAFT_142805 [Galerina marginata CBS 339.88]|uniref:N-acetyltransferase domain-containing protein n=1 Tax=Galerina marginata (strain CBS 339.88) TaxID=685588 RepID=A0A067SNI9_GALM3|nr:hypothetical protein GALMADRAFT_142805 [Galerina marginata CBS 339.88]